MHNFNYHHLSADAEVSDQINARYTLLRLASMGYSISGFHNALLTILLSKPRPPRMITILSWELFRFLSPNILFTSSFPSLPGQSSLFGWIKALKRDFTDPWLSHAGQKSKPQNYPLLTQIRSTILTVLPSLSSAILQTIWKELPMNDVFKYALRDGSPLIRRLATKSAILCLIKMKDDSSINSFLPIITIITKESLLDPDIRTSYETASLFRWIILEYASRKTWDFSNSESTFSFLDLHNTLCSIDFSEDSKTNSTQPIIPAFSPSLLSSCDPPLSPKQFAIHRKIIQFILNSLYSNITWEALSSRYFSLPLEFRWSFISIFFVGFSRGIFSLSNIDSLFTYSSSNSSSCSSLTYELSMHFNSLCLSSPDSFPSTWLTTSTLRLLSLLGESNVGKSSIFSITQPIIHAVTRILPHLPKSDISYQTTYFLLEKLPLLTNLSPSSFRISTSLHSWSILINKSVSDTKDYWRGRLNRKPTPLPIEKLCQSQWDVPANIIREEITLSLFTVLQARFDTILLPWCNMLAYLIERSNSMDLHHLTAVDYEYLALESASSVSILDSIKQVFFWKTGPRSFVQAKYLDLLENFLRLFACLGWYFALRAPVEQGSNTFTDSGSGSGSGGPVTTIDKTDSETINSENLEDDIEEHSWPPFQLYASFFDTDTANSISSPSPFLLTTEFQSFLIRSRQTNSILQHLLLFILNHIKQIHLRGSYVATRALSIVTRFIQTMNPTIRKIIFPAIEERLVASDILSQYVKQDAKIFLGSGNATALSESDLSQLTETEPDLKFAITKRQKALNELIQDAHDMSTQMQTELGGTIGDSSDFIGIGHDLSSSDSAIFDSIYCIAIRFPLSTIDCKKILRRYGTRLTRDSDTFKRLKQFHLYLDQTETGLNHSRLLSYFYWLHWPHSTLTDKEDIPKIADNDISDEKSETKDPHDSSVSDDSSYKTQSSKPTTTILPEHAYSSHGAKNSALGLGYHHFESDSFLQSLSILSASTGAGFSAVHGTLPLLPDSTVEFELDLVGTQDHLIQSLSLGINSWDKTSLNLHSVTSHSEFWSSVASIDPNYRDPLILSASEKKNLKALQKELSEVSSGLSPNPNESNKRTDDTSVKLPDHDTNTNTNITVNHDTVVENNPQDTFSGGQKSDAFGLGLLDSINFAPVDPIDHGSKHTGTNDINLDLALINLDTSTGHDIATSPRLQSPRAMHSTRDVVSAIPQSVNTAYHKASFLPKPLTGISDILLIQAWHLLNPGAKSIIVFFQFKNPHENKIPVHISVSFSHTGSSRRQNSVEPLIIPYLKPNETFTCQLLFILDSFTQLTVFPQCAIGKMIEIPTELLQQFNAGPSVPSGISGISGEDNTNNLDNGDNSTAIESLIHNCSPALTSEFLSKRPEAEYINFAWTAHTLIFDHRSSLKAPGYSVTQSDLFKSIDFSTQPISAISTLQKHLSLAYNRKVFDSPDTGSLFQRTLQTWRHPPSQPIDFPHPETQGLVSRLFKHEQNQLDSIFSEIQNKHSTPLIPPNTQHTLIQEGNPSFPLYSLVSFDIFSFDPDMLDLLPPQVKILSFQQLESNLSKENQKKKAGEQPLESQEISWLFELVTSTWFDTQITTVCSVSITKFNMACYSNSISIIEELNLDEFRSWLFPTLPIRHVETISNQEVVPKRPKGLYSLSEWISDNS